MSDLLPLPGEDEQAYTARTGVRVHYKELETWRTHRGCVLCVSDVESIQRGWDDYGTDSVRRVLVWNHANGCEQTLTVCGESRTTCWVADAPQDVQDVHLKWVLEQRNPAMARRWVENETQLSITQAQRAIDTILNTPERGQTWVVVRGRKVPQGTSGHVFWVGDTRYGAKIGISPSGVRDSNGKYSDAVFVAVGNCRMIPDSQTQQVVDDHQATIERLQHTLEQRVAVKLHEFNTSAILEHRKHAG
jgi:hypothetical protein